MTEPQYNPQKFRELLVYLAERSLGDPHAGETKLQKLLYHADFAAYRRLGRPITGACYERYPHGPFTDRLKAERAELEREEAVHTEDADAGGYEQRRTIPDRPANLSIFEPEELALVEELLVEYRDHNASAMAAQSHEEAGWKLANEREAIPYATALIETGPVPDAVIAEGKELLEQYGW
jgi:uncharacterized phage-associated protein